MTHKTDMQAVLLDAMRAHLGPKYCPPSGEPDNSFLSPVSVAAPQAEAAQAPLTAEQRKAIMPTAAEVIELFKRAVKELPASLATEVWQLTPLQAAWVVGMLIQKLATAPQAEVQSPEVPIELRDVAAVLEEGDGFWRSCSGCHETNEGYETGHYPYSTILKCVLGAGCSECGGIGAVWDDTDYGAMAAAGDADEIARDSVAPSPDREQVGEADLKKVDEILDWIVGMSTDAPVTNMARRALELLRASPSRERGEQDCPHGVDDGACKQCYDEAVRGEQEAAKGVCQRCGGTGVVADGEITGAGGVEFENGPVKCVKDCPDCAASTPTLGDDPCPFCPPGQVCRTPKCGRLAQPQAAEPKGLTSGQQETIRYAAAILDQEAYHKTANDLRALLANGE